MNISDDNDQDLQRALLASMSTTDAAATFLPIVREEDDSLQRALPESFCTSNSSTYIVTLSKDDRRPRYDNEGRFRRLGVTCESDNGTLRLLNWRRDSAIARWNDEHPGTKVRANDAIVSVDGFEIQGSYDRLSEALARAYESEDPVMIVAMQRAGFDSEQINSHVPSTGCATDRFSAVWYNNIGGVFRALPDDHGWDEALHKDTLRFFTDQLDRLVLEVERSRPTILYVIFGGLLPPHRKIVKGMIQRGACLDRRFPPPLLRLLAKERDATLLIAVLDEGCKRAEYKANEAELPESIAATTGNRVSVHLVPFSVPRWPCVDILNRFRQLKEGVTRNGGLFIVMDELKCVRKGCFHQVFALYPILDLCTECPENSLFLEWSSGDGKDDLRGEIYTYRSREERSKEDFRVVRQWNGLRRHFERDEWDVFNFLVQDKQTEKGKAQRCFSIDLTKRFYE